MSQMSSTSKGVSHSIDVQAPNPGNPVFTCDSNFTKTAPNLVNGSATKEPLSKEPHPMYVTTSSSYGALQGTVETTPNSFHGRSQKFSEHLGQSGMYRNHSLNTASNHSRV